MQEANNEGPNQVAWGQTPGWQEREQRQRSVRVWMMFLFFMLLMDDDNATSDTTQQQLRGSTNHPQRKAFNKDVYNSRRRQDERIYLLTNAHNKSFQLIQRNHGKDMAKMIQDWAMEQSEMEKDEFFVQQRQPTTSDDPEEERKVFHYPWNTTGFYRGEWKRIYEQKETNATFNNVTLTPKQVEEAYSFRMLETRNEAAAVVLLPNILERRDDNNLTSTNYDTTLVDSNGKTEESTLDGASGITLTQDNGRVAFQLFSRKVPAMREISLVDGFVKLYESSKLGYSTRKDMLLRVRGVLFHRIGKLSLVNYMNVNRTALLLQKHGIEVSVQDLNDTAWSDYVLPYPFVRDDAEETLRKVRTQASRLMPPREQALEWNAAGCDFEINMDIEEVEWKVGSWRKLIARRILEARLLDPERQQNERLKEEEHPSKPLSVASVAGRGRRRRKPVQDEALALQMTGTIHSGNCNFTAFLNTTALRTDWDAATGKAIRYSFWTTFISLVQIFLLLRQVLHSQTLATATRVSLLSVGWNATIDALQCLVHIYLSLAMSPLFTAFASVAFFKLLIFCVIEMKYMVVIIQARNSSEGGQTAEAFRRQVAMLHLRFYVALMSVFVVLFYAIEKYRTASVLLLYSFWVPQIILNVITEARSPLDRVYIYGMSLSRTYAPLYVFAISDNFLKEVYPESPTDVLLVLKIVVWVAIQAAMLLSQEKYGPRFMIPARFLPPKFDYSRPLPASMIPPGALDMPASELIEDRTERTKAAKTETLTVGPSRHKTAETTRNRLKTSRPNAMVAEEHHCTASPASLPVPTLECSICYDDIDIRDRPNYMLAPCNHLFHRGCLTRWMEAKLECPICRTNLPSL